ncbi:unnamed protein product [Bursaphelenchus okinawaensis]|uniref:tRNA pseudouridine synthase n=1 Tax=Bursaphelenchus okinawaensis TaxID=465554 RepID=A0A811KX85_9BILA|nr:unnamed protein product [Bursaphelenchus okinawaensis]CAG9113180.1 unnamed protein product [Bursaphelenchus okinawaensis]
MAATYGNDKGRVFDYSKYPQRRIALMFLYLGWEHDGLVPQPTMANTVEEVLINALLRSRLILTSECGLNRCGRTDKGVSGFRQVCSVIVRSTDVNGKHVFWSEDSDQSKRIKSTSEIDYVKILNAVLPYSIRILGWAPCDRDFNARFNCTERVYNYIFPKNNFDIEKMREASKLLVGSHDFRNFCRIDNNKARLETTYVREIFDIQLDELRSEESDNVYKIYQLKVKGSGFLWHMIRCIVGVLFEIGGSGEDIEVINQLLDVETCPSRPQYQLAKETPLCFFDCNYSIPLEWIFDKINLKKAFQTLEKTWSDLKVKCETVKNMMYQLSGFIQEDSHEAMDEYIRDGPRPKKKIALMNRPRCASLDDRIQRMASKKCQQEM